MLCSVIGPNARSAHAEALRPATSLRGPEGHRRLPLFGARASGSAVETPVPTTSRVAPRAVRLSITDRCDLACVYCRPSRRDGYLPSERRLSVRDFRVLMEALVAKGVRRARLTGGEPLMHPEVVELVRAIASVPGLEDLALTTNATRLRTLAGPLRAAGLRRINVSMDSLDETRFAALSRGGRLSDVMAGLEAAVAVGFEEIKLNTVVVGPALHETPDEPTRDPVAANVRNDDELEAIARFAWSIGATPRFLELMTVGEGARLGERFVPFATMHARLSPMLEDATPSRQADRGPAIYLAARDNPDRRIGFITGTSATFCAGCDRLRVGSDGGLRPCLAKPDAYSVREEIFAGDLDAIGAQLDRAWSNKPDGVAWKGCTEPTAADVNMRQTGG
jgi:GTP 3',8-cyclase